MTDKELLELAARAVGINGKWIERRPDDGYATYSSGIGFASRITPPWNPLTDSGDALELAVKLNLLIMPYPFDKGVRVVNSANADNTIVSWGTPPDPQAATRRAIVRAAAEIGKAVTSDNQGKAND